MEKAVIINLDGSLVKTKSNRDIPLHSEDWEIPYKILEGIRILKERGYFICVVSNQPQVKQGLYSKERYLEKVNTILKTIERRLKIKNTEPIAFRYCLNENSYDYMPKPGMIYELAINEELDLNNSIFIGNHVIHELLAERVGIKQYYNITEFNPEFI